LTQEYIEPTRQSRIGLSLVGLTAIGVAFGLIYFGPTYFQPPSSHSVCEALDHYRGMMQKGSLFLIIPGLWLCYYASRLLRTGQSPAPGAWVIHRAVIKTGPEVTQSGYFLLLLGMLIAASPSFFWSDFSQFEKENVALVCNGN
jgi:hypothetical protein